MFRFLWYSSLFLWCAFAVSYSECEVPYSCTSASVYYWREYLGAIPDDAVEGGHDEAGNTTYIGQVLSPTTKGILTAVIYPGKKEAVSTAALKRFAEANYVKILCSAERKKFEWKKTHVQDLHLLTDFHLVKGGIEADHPLYVGRKLFEGELMVGKVFDDSYWARGLRLPTSDGTEYGTLSFEILVYPRQCVNKKNETTTTTSTTTTTTSTLKPI